MKSMKRCLIFILFFFSLSAEVGIESKDIAKSDKPKLNDKEKLKFDDVLIEHIVKGLKIEKRDFKGDKKSSSSSTYVLSNLLSGYYPFADYKSLSIEGRSTKSLGLGARGEIEGKMQVGGYCFCDGCYKNISQKAIRSGVGVELLGSRVDLRACGYMPIMRGDLVKEGYSGGEAEVGVHTPKRGLYLGFGPYYKEKFGLSARCLIDAANNLKLQLQLLNSEVEMALVFRYPFQPKSKIGVKSNNSKNISYPSIIRSDFY